MHGPLFTRARAGRLAATARTHRRTRTRTRRQAGRQAGRGGGWGKQPTSRVDNGLLPRPCPAQPAHPAHGLCCAVRVGGKATDPWGARHRHGEATAERKRERERGERGERPRERGARDQGREKQREQAAAMAMAAATAAGLRACGLAGLLRATLASAIHSIQNASHIRMPSGGRRRHPLRLDGAGHRHKRSPSRSYPPTSARARHGGGGGYVGSRDAAGGACCMAETPGCLAGMCADAACTRASQEQGMATGAFADARTAAAAAADTRNAV